MHQLLDQVHHLAQEYFYLAYLIKTKPAKTLQPVVWKPPTNPYITLNADVESLEIVMGTG